MNEEIKKIVEDFQKKLDNQEETIKNLYILQQAQVSVMGALFIKRGLISESELEEAIQKSVSVVKEKVEAEWNS